MARRVDADRGVIGIFWVQFDRFGSAANQTFDGNLVVDTRDDDRP